MYKVPVTVIVFYIHINSEYSQTEQFDKLCYSKVFCCEVVPCNYDLPQFGQCLFTKTITFMNTLLIH